MTVDIRMEIAKDGTVTKADIINKNRMNVDGSFRRLQLKVLNGLFRSSSRPLPL